MNIRQQPAGRRRVGTFVCAVVVAAGAYGATALVDATAAHAAAPTSRVVVRPVTASGHAAKGYAVRTESRSVSCDEASRGAVDDGIAYCGLSADYTVACWHSSTRSRVLCLPDPSERRLESIKLDGKFPRVTAPRHPSPQAVRTVVGGYYLVRDGGAGPMLKYHRSWAADYFGTNNGRFVAGPQGTDGVKRRHATWFVTSFGTPDQHGTRQKLATAYFVGTRH